jgi:hypothetical protein
MTETEGADRLSDLPVFGSRWETEVRTVTVGGGAGAGAGTWASRETARKEPKASRR